MVHSVGRSVQNVPCHKYGPINGGQILFSRAHYVITSMDIFELSKFFLSSEQYTAWGVSLRLLYSHYVLYWHKVVYLILSFIILSLVIQISFWTNCRLTHNCHYHSEVWLPWLRRQFLRGFSCRFWLRGMLLPCPQGKQFSSLFPWVIFSNMEYIWVAVLRWRACAVQSHLLSIYPNLDTEYKQ